MTKPPKYPLPAADVSDKIEQQRRIEGEPPPADLYAVPSFKFRHEVREPLESSEAAHRRAYPEFYRRLPPRLARRTAIRGR
jgi:hypothetical protein